MVADRNFTWRTPVIAIDFDGCLCTDKYPEIGSPNWEVINEAKRLRALGACLVLWTCRAGQQLDDAVMACHAWGLEFDAVNENPQFRIDLYGGNDCRKVGADEYWDDRSVYMGAPGEFRNIRGATVRVVHRAAIRKFMDEVLRPQIDYLTRLRRDELGRKSWGFYGGLGRVLQTALEQMELMMALLDERNEAHSWYKDGYNDATQNAAKWVSDMFRPAGDEGAEQDGSE